MSPLEAVGVSFPEIEFSATSWVSLNISYAIRFMYAKSRLQFCVTFHNVRRTVPCRAVHIFNGSSFIVSFAYKFQKNHQMQPILRLFTTSLLFIYAIFSVAGIGCSHIIVKFLKRFHRTGCNLFDKLEPAKIRLNFSTHWNVVWLEHENALLSVKNDWAMVLPNET